MYPESMFVGAGHMHGDGWYDDAKSFAKRAAKTLQHNEIVRAAEKGIVHKGADALRAAAETGTDALVADVAPEFAPMASKAIDRGAKALEKRGVAYLDQKIDQSGNGVRYMAATSGGGMRRSGAATQIGRGLRLAKGSGHGMQAEGLRLAGSGYGMQAQGLRLAGSGHSVKPHYMRGAGNCESC
jgi:hypothetical protein